MAQLPLMLPGMAKRAMIFCSSTSASPSTAAAPTAHAPPLARLHWGVLVVDEGHRLKNKTSKLFQVRRGGDFWNEEGN
jgi:hypothetical protein